MAIKRNKQSWAVSNNGGEIPERTLLGQLKKIIRWTVGFISMLHLNVY